MTRYMVFWMLLPPVVVLVFAVFALTRRPFTPAPDAAAERRPAPRPRVAAPPPSPSAARQTAGNGHIRVTVDPGGLSVDRLRSGFFPRWSQQLSLRWEDVTALELGRAARDGVLGLYAVKHGGRHHVIDARTLTQRQWAAVAGAAHQATNGRIRINLGGLGRPPSAG